MVLMPTYIDLFGSEAEAIAYYKEIIKPVSTITDETIKNALITAYYKIDPIFGEFRLYKVGEDTVRNEHVKRSICFEADEIIALAPSGGPVGGSIGKIDSGMGFMGDIISEKIGNITKVYGDGASVSSGGGVMGSDRVQKVLGLFSFGAGILLSRYIQKSFAWSGNGYINGRRLKRP